MKLGITQYAARPDGRGYLEYAAELGLDGVEPYIGDTDSESLSWSVRDCERLARRAAELGVRIPSVAVGVFNGDPAIVEAPGREAAVRITTDCLRFTASIGAETMLLCTYIKSDPDTPDRKSNLLQVVRDVEPTARELGIRIGLESPIPAAEFAEFVDEIGSDCVGIYYDVGNSVHLGFDPAEEIGILGDRIIAMHVKDTVSIMGDAHLGKGRVDLPASMAALKRIGYDGWIVIETQGGDDAATRADVRVMRQYL